MGQQGHFLEAHYYSGGLRHFAYPENTERPSWAPPADSVGFQNEFDLGEGDAAVEIRRYRIADERITWLGIYRRSLDDKLGDRSNHAGLGLWMRNCFPTDVHNLLYGLDSLSAHMAKTFDPNALKDPIAKFAGASFLPSYLRSLDDYPDLDGIPFASESIVDTQRYFAHCENGVGECRALSDFILTKLLFGSGTQSTARALFLTSKSKTEPTAGARIESISQSFDAGAQLANAIPIIIEKVGKRFHESEKDISELCADLAHVRSDNEKLRSEHTKYAKLIDDPLVAVMDRLDGLSSQVDRIVSRPAATNWQPPLQSPIRQRGPIRSDSQSRPVEEVTEPDLLFWTMFAAGLFLIILIIWAVFNFIPWARIFGG